MKLVLLFILFSIAAAPAAEAAGPSATQKMAAIDADDAWVPAEMVSAAPDAEAETSAAERETRAVEARVEQVEANLAAVREVLDIGLADDDAGELLREARRRAPEPVVVQRRVAARERQVAEARLNRVRLLERRRLTDDEDEVYRLTAELTTQEAYLAALTDALAAERKLAREGADLVALLDARLLWIGSAPPVGPQWVKDVVDGVTWMIDPQRWIGMGQTFVRRLGQTPVMSFVLTVLAAVLIFIRPKLRARLTQLAEGTGKYSSDSFLLTARALVVTLLLAAPAPLALFSIGSLLVSQSVDVFAQALGHGLMAGGAVVLLLDVFRLMCRSKGLADAHFNWNTAARRTLQVNLRWLLPVQVAAAMVVVTCDNGGQEVYRQGLGRLGFMVGSIALTVFVARVFRPTGGVFTELMPRDGWAWRLRRPWYGAIVLLPAVLTLAAAAGYYFTATEVLSRFFTTGVVVLAGIVVYSLLTLWLLVTRRRLVIRQARQKLADQREARQRANAANASADAATTDTSATVSGEAVPDLEVQTVDVEAASSQTLSLLRTLVATGVLALLWAVWNDILPALEVLRSVALSGVTVDSEGNVIVPAVTLWSLLLGVVTAVLTVVAAKNLPAVLELAVLQRFPLDSGTRYAAATLARYVVVAIGIVIASNLIGINWGRAQWIVAALGVGLGFGLQEIVANFVSGLIILFERPVRVGDVVTVGDVSGTVSRLQIRATTITDWDNKEVLVPNKSFITDRVVNWTLSSAVTRMLIPVGIAYGSDVAVAHAALTRAVRSVPTVLNDPAPSVLFVSFGESSLNFEIRAFVGELGKRLTTLHDLHIAMNAALAEANIEIPFPQRDLHLRTSDIGPLAAAAPALTAQVKGQQAEPSDSTQLD